MDKFKFLRSSIKDGSSNMHSVRLLDEDFVEDSAKQESAVQFRVEFSSSVYGNFEQKLVFDFGGSLVLARSLYVSVVSEDFCNVPPRTTYCRILEWSLQEMQLVLCKDLIALDSDGVCAQYNVPNVLPDPSEIGEFKRETYCKLWHEILFIEEKHIQMEVARYRWILISFCLFLVSAVAAGVAVAVAVAVGWCWCWCWCWCYCWCWCWCWCQWRSQPYF